MFHQFFPAFVPEGNLHQQFSLTLLPWETLPFSHLHTNTHPEGLCKKLLASMDLVAIAFFLAGLGCLLGFVLTVAYGYDESTPSFGSYTVRCLHN